MLNIANIAFEEHLKSTNVADFGSVWKQILVNRQMLN